MEYVPLVVKDWLTASYEKNLLYVKQIQNIIRFLMSKNIIHFDIHTANMLSDGDIIYLIDYGLVYDYAFVTTANEKLFYDNNTYYDYAKGINGLMNGLKTKLDRPMLEEYNLKRDDSEKILLHIDDIAGKLDLESGYVELLKKYNKVIIAYEKFMKQLQNNVHTEFPNADVRYLATLNDF